MNSLIRNCTNCNKALAKTTKGELCQTCYRNRNQVCMHDLAKQNDIAITCFKDSNKTNEIDNTQLNIMENQDKDDTEINNIFDVNSQERTIVDIIKANMVHERKSNDELITILKEQNDFLKKELLQKNVIIDNLLNLCSHNNNKIPDIATSNTIDNNIYDNFSLVEKSDYEARSDYMQWQSVNSNYTKKHTPINKRADNIVVSPNRFSSLNIENDDVTTNVFDNTDDVEQPRKHEIRNNNKADKRPLIVHNQHPERDFSSNYSRQNSGNNLSHSVKRTSPGNSSYADLTKSGKKLFIFSSSLTKPINMNNFNDRLKSGTAFKRAFGGATASQLKYYIQAALNEDHPDRVIINVGTNNLTKKDQTPLQIAEEIIEVAQTCREGGVNEIYVSGITCRPQFQAKINEINKLLEYYAGYKNYVYIDNRCIGREHLRRDNLHLNKEGIRILTDNFLKHLNSISLLDFNNIWN